jgi:UDPglucose 6-dehydrogenase
MNVAIIGTGYAGLIAGAGFAELGNNVTCLDRDADKTKHQRHGKSAINEEGLPQLLAVNVQAGRLKFTESWAEALAHAEIVFAAIGGEVDGAIDLDVLMSAAREIGRHLDHRVVVVNQATVPVGTTERLRAAIQDELHARGRDVEFAVVSMPEFLGSGKAVHDFLKPKHIVIGVDDDWAKERMRKLCHPLDPAGRRMRFMSPREAEMSKHAANAMSATRAALSTEITLLCSAFGLDADTVCRSIDYGGRGSPTDVNVLLHAATAAGVDTPLLQVVENGAGDDGQRLHRQLERRFGNDLADKAFGLWGLAIGPGNGATGNGATGNAAACGLSPRALLEHLIGHGAHVYAYDPEHEAVARRELPEEWFTSGRLTLVEHLYDACREVDALILATDWARLPAPDFSAMKRLMREPVIFDSSNRHTRKALTAAGFEYCGIGRLLNGADPEVRNGQMV